MSAASAVGRRDGSASGRLVPSHLISESACIQRPTSLAIPAKAASNGAAFQKPSNGSGMGMLTGLMRRLRRRLLPSRGVIEGYEHRELVETVFQKTRAYQPQGTWPLMAGASAVLDFGGGLRTALQARPAANTASSLGRGGNPCHGRPGIGTDYRSPALLFRRRRGCRLARPHGHHAFQRRAAVHPIRWQSWMCSAD